MSSQMTLLLKIKEMLRDVDLLELIDAGAPDDEYDNEGYQLLSLLLSRDNEEISNQNIIDIFQKSFDQPEFNNHKISQIVMFLNNLKTEMGNDKN